MAMIMKKIQHQQMYLSALVLYLLTYIGSADPSPVIFPLNGNVYPQGHFYMTLTMGADAKPYFLVIDTGSDVTWVQCNIQNAINYDAPHQPYTPDMQKVLLPNDPSCIYLTQSLAKGYNSDKYCDYEIHYEDGSSTEGFLINDTIIFNDKESPVNIVFGCGYNQFTRDVTHQHFLDGIIGLGMGVPSLLSQLQGQGIAKNIIGHCLSRNGNGYLILGDYSTEISLDWVPIFSQASVYYLTKADILLEDDQLSDIRNLDIVFDSGSTYTYLLPGPYGALVDLIERYNTNSEVPLVRADDLSLPFCWKGDLPFTSVDNVTTNFPHLALNFTNSNVKFFMGLESYLIISDKGNVCLGILNAGEIQLGFNLIGDISFQDKLVIYDNEQRQVGWAQADCDSIPS